LLRQKCVQILELQLCQDIKTKEHDDAVNKIAMTPDTFSNTQRRVFGKQSQAILTEMRAVYWLAKEGIATVKYDSLLNFLGEVGLESVKNLPVGGNATYRSHQSVKSMQDAIRLLF